jgi:hypothetical protein
MGLPAGVGDLMSACRVPAGGRQTRVMTRAVIRAVTSAIGSLLLAGTCATAEERTTTTGPDVLPPEHPGEQLLVEIPEGWVAVNSIQQQELHIAEYLDPTNLTAERVDSVRLEALTGDPLPDPIEFLGGLRDLLRENCKGFVDFPISTGFENGFPSAVRLMLCREQKEPTRGLIRMVKAIQGDQAFYIVSRSRSTPPFTAGNEPMSVEDMGYWSAWIGAVRLCATAPGGETALGRAPGCPNEDD